MRFRLPLLAALVAILAVGAVAKAGLFAPATADSSHPAADGKSLLTFRCRVLASPQATEDNARAAHAFFEQAIRQIARLQVSEMAAQMKPDRPSAEIAADLAEPIARGDALRAEAAQDLQRRFGCSYRGSS